MSGSLVRPLRPGDGAALERLVAEMQDYERGIDPRLLPGAEMAAAYTEAMVTGAAARAGVILVAEVGGALAGFVALQAEVRDEELDQPPGTYALVSDLAVTAAHRGRGIGGALLRAAEEHARRQGATELRIAVLADNAVARGLYVASGFRPYLEVMNKALTGPG